MAYAQGTEVTPERSQQEIASTIRKYGDRTSGRPLTFTARELDIVRLVLHLLAAGFTLEAAFGISVRLADEDSYTVRLADIFELSISVIQPDDRPAVDAPTSQEATE